MIIDIERNGDHLMSNSFESIIQDNRIVGSYKQILPEDAALLGAAVGTWLKNKATIAIARDFRIDSRMMKRAFTGGLMSTGVSALDFHGSPTPLLQFYIRRFGADAGVMFTSGHYEDDKTSIRIFDETGAELTFKKLNEILEIYKNKNIRRVSPAEMINIEDATGATDVYIEGIKNVIDRESIANSNFKVVIDCALGPTSIVFPSILNDLNVEVIAINSFNPKIIPKSLPNSESLVSLAKTVIANDANLGVAFDVEGGRAVFCDEKGKLRSSDSVAAGLVSYIADRSLGDIILSESISKNVDMMVEKMDKDGVKVIRVRDYPGAIASKIREEGGIFGASDTGSFWAPAFTVDSDGMFIALKVLEVLSKLNQPLSSYLDKMRLLPMKIKSIEVNNNLNNNLFAYLEEIVSYEEDLQFKYNIDILSGTKVVFTRGWVSVYASHQDSKIINLVAEADDDKVMNNILKSVIDKIQKFIAN